MPFIYHILLIILVIIFIVSIYKQIFPSEEFKDEIISQHDYDISYRAPYSDRFVPSGKERRYVIKRTYSSGRIKLIEKTVSI